MDENFQEYNNDSQKIIIKHPTFDVFYKNISIEPFDEKSIKILTNKIDEDDIEIRFDGIIFLPEIKYRKILNQAFGIGAWSLILLNPVIDEQRSVVYYDGALFIKGRYHARATGEQIYIKNNPNMTWATALEGAKSNCLMRCCKDLGIASELWDPQFIKKYKKEYGLQVWCENQAKQKKLFWRRKSDPPYNIFPWKEISATKKQENKKSETVLPNVYPTEEVQPIEVQSTNSNKSIDELKKECYQILKSKKLLEIITKQWDENIQQAQTEKILLIIKNQLEKIK